MPSPFPGMDPYLESPDWFPDLHDNLIFSIKAALQERLPAAYYARSRQRVWLELEHRPVEPDVDVLRAGGAQSRFHEPEGGAVAVAELVTTEPVVVTVESIEGNPFEEPFLEIRRRQGTDDVLVASMEILSPSNKTQGNSGRVMYLAKQQEILKGPVHLIEIDLLRGGTHSPRSPRNWRLRRPAHSIITFSSIDSINSRTSTSIRSCSERSCPHSPFPSCPATPTFRLTFRRPSTEPTTADPTAEWFTTARTRFCRPFDPTRRNGSTQHSGGS